jgi:pimeloyl-ACP methyl ester carboxylesterase
LGLALAVEDVRDFTQAMKACVACFAFVLTLCGCVPVDFGLPNLMSADRSPRTAVLPQGYVVQDVVIPHGDQLIGVTYAHNPQSHAVIVFCGGNTFHRLLEGGEALETLARDADVVLFDYPGYGESTGPATPTAILEDALAVYDYATAMESSAGKKRVVYGFSLGGMVAAQVAGRRAVGGLVLEATAPNVETWARSQIPWFAKPIVRPRIEADLASIDTFAALRSFGGEVLVMTSPADEQAPASLSVDMDREFRRMGLRTTLVQFPSAAHGAIPRSPQYGVVFASFLDRVKEATLVIETRDATPTIADGQRSGRVTADADVP